MTIAGADDAEISATFWQGLREGRLRVPICRRCGMVFFFPRRWCPSCWADDVGWIEATGLGVVYARTEVHIPFPGIAASDLPVTELLVDLDEGPRMCGRAGSDASGAQIGDRVRLVFPLDSEQEMPFFIPV